jgi:hypothetical protein
LGNPNETNTKKDGAIMDKGAEDPPCTNYRKRKMSDKENSDAWTIRVKKSGVSVRILITSLSYRVRKEGHPHQVS